MGRYVAANFSRVPVTDEWYTVCLLTDSNHA